MAQFRTLGSASGSIRIGGGIAPRAEIRRPPRKAAYRQRTLPLFGGLLVLAFATFLGGVSSGAETYIATGIAALVVVGCAAALTHQLARLVDALERRSDDAD